MRKLLTTLVVLLIGMTAQSNPAQEAMDREEIIETINAIGLYADFNQWDRVAAQFADEVVIDYTSYTLASVGADEPEAISPQEVITAWQTVLPGYAYTQHLVGNHQVDISGDEATAVSTVHATHILENAEGDDFWIFLGDYEHHLVRTRDGWRVTRMTANLRSELGNLNLPRLAEEQRGRARYSVSAYAQACVDLATTT